MDPDEHVQKVKSGMETMERRESAMPLCNARVAIKDVSGLLVVGLVLGELRESVYGHDEIVM